jgi:putative ubiquitin-RnfH superfamily antitoxin RatB of RatAB toxin-antitoxin module
MIQVEVCYGKSDVQVLIPIELPQGSTVAKAIMASGILDRFSELNLSEVKVGIFSNKVALDWHMRSGDRIEIYRPLLLEPNQARLLRMKKARSSR